MTSRAYVLLAALLLVDQAWAQTKSPIGPELAPKEIGVLLKAYPMATLRLPVDGTTWVSLWGCDYKVGQAIITLTYSTKNGDPMPCKRKVQAKGPSERSRSSEAGPAQSSLS